MQGVIQRLFVNNPARLSAITLRQIFQRRHHVGIHCGAMLGSKSADGKVNVEKQGAVGLGKIVGRICSPETALCSSRFRGAPYRSCDFPPDRCNRWGNRLSLRARCRSKLNILSPRAPDTTAWLFAYCKSDRSIRSPSRTRTKIMPQIAGGPRGWVLGTGNPGRVSDIQRPRPDASPSVRNSLSIVPS